MHDITNNSYSLSPLTSEGTCDMVHQNENQREENKSPLHDHGREWYLLTVLHVPREWITKGEQAILPRRNSR